MKNIIRISFRFLFRFLLRTFFKVRVTGDFEGANAKRLLIVANHTSFIDGFLIGVFLPVDPVFVVHSSIAAKRTYRILLCLADYLAVDSTNAMAMKKVIRLVESGRPVVIFPEGRISLTGSLMKIYEGSAFVAAKTGATIIPVRLDGTSRTYFSALGGRHPKSFSPPIRIVFLPPTKILLFDAENAKDRRHEAADAMRRMMQKMIVDADESKTLYGSFCDAVQIFGKSRPILEDIKQVEYRYRDLLKMVLMLGRLMSRHTALKETVGLLLPNLAPTMGVFFGLSALQRIPAMLNYTAGTDALEAACVAAGIRTVLTSRAFVEQAKLAGKLDALTNIRILYLEDLREEVGFLDKLWLVCFALHFPRHFEKTASAEESAVVLFTSGSEGKPKGVVLSHRAILKNITQIRAVIDFSVEDKVLNALPVFHSFGLTAGALLPLLSGARLFLYPSPLHYRVIPEIAYDRSCTVLFGTSTFLGHYARFANAYDFYSVRYVVAGAEKLSEAVRSAWFEKFGLRIFEGYGATETAPVLAVNTPMAYKTGTVGQLLPGVEHLLVPVPGIDVGGMLHVRCPNLMSGYLRSENPMQIEPPVSDVGAGWYETGDVVDIDREGFVKIIGRVKRFAKIAGEMISLEVSENLAFAVSSEKMHAVIAVPDESRGESLILFTTDEKLSRELLGAKARERGIPELAVPRKIKVVEAIPLLGTGKIDYVAVNRMAAS